MMEHLCGLAAKNNLIVEVTTIIMIDVVNKNKMIDVVWTTKLTGTLPETAVLWLLWNIMPRINLLRVQSTSGDVIIISQNSSKSMVPEPSSSISSMMASKSSSVNLGSTSAMMFLNWTIVMKPDPSLSKSRNAVLSSALIVSGSGSSTRNFAQSWANSANSMAPE